MWGAVLVLAGEIWVVKGLVTVYPLTKGKPEPYHKAMTRASLTTVLAALLHVSLAQSTSTTPPPTLCGNYSSFLPHVHARWECVGEISEAASLSAEACLANGCNVSQVLSYSFLLCLKFERLASGIRYPSEAVDSVLAILRSRGQCVSDSDFVDIYGASCEDYADHPEWCIDAAYWGLCSVSM